MRVLRPCSLEQPLNHIILDQNVTYPSVLACLLGAGDLEERRALGAGDLEERRASGPACKRRGDVEEIRPA